MVRVRRIVMVVFFGVVACWMGMMLVHEGGHVLGVWVSGGEGGAGGA